MKGDRPCVYYISDGQGHCKVGIATNLNSRMNTLQVGSPYELKLLHAQYYDDIELAREQEDYAHYILDKHVIRGEWYEEEAVTKFIENGCKDPIDPQPEIKYPKEYDLFHMMIEWEAVVKSKTYEEYIEWYENNAPEWEKKWDLERNDNDPRKLTLHLIHSWLYVHLNEAGKKKLENEWEGKVREYLAQN